MTAARNSFETRLSLSFIVSIDSISQRPLRITSTQPNALHLGAGAPPLLLPACHHSISRCGICYDESTISLSPPSMKSGEGSVQSHKLSIAPYCAIKLLCSPPLPSETTPPTTDRFFMAFLLGIAISSGADSPPSCETVSRGRFAFAF